MAFHGVGARRTKFAVGGQVGWVPPKLGEGEDQVPWAEIQDLVLVVPAVVLGGEGAVLFGDLDHQLNLLPLLGGQLRGLPVRGSQRLSP